MGAEQARRGWMAAGPSTSPRICRSSTSPPADEAGEGRSAGPKGGGPADLRAGYSHRRATPNPIPAGCPTATGCPRSSAASYIEGGAGGIASNRCRRSRGRLAWPTSEARSTGVARLVVVVSVVSSRSPPGPTVGRLSSGCGCATRPGVTSRFLRSLAGACSATAKRSAHDGLGQSGLCYRWPWKCCPSVLRSPVLRPGETVRRQGHCAKA